MHSFPEMCVFFVLLQGAIAAIANLPYVTAINCREKQSSLVHKTVLKSREVVKKKGFWVFRKTIKDTVYYNETVPVIVYHCCTGYRFVEQHEHCVPHCDPPCPIHAECWHTNSCKCRHDYVESYETHTQEPADLQCIPQNVEVEVEAETEAAQTYTEDVDIDINSSTWDTSTEFYIGETYDCRLNVCPEYAKCAENGTCLCLDGYVWHEMESSMPYKLGMLFDLSCQAVNGTLSARAETQDSVGIFTLELLMVISGVVVVFGLVVALIYLLKRQSKQMDCREVETKEKSVLWKFAGDKQESSSCVVY